MIKRFFEWLLQPLGLVAVLIAVIGVFSLAVYGINQTQTARWFGYSVFVLSPWRIARTITRATHTIKVLGLPSTDRQDQYQPQAGGFG
jgi:hypothetical protein